MRIALVHISQETDTFNPSPTTLDDFATYGIHSGQELLDKARGSGTIGGYIAAVEGSGLGVETVPIIRGLAGAAGRITTEALRFFEDRLRSGLADAGQLDGLALQLHGACAAADLDDVEGYLGSIAREVLGPGVPIVMTLDHHANVTQQMVDSCDAMLAFRTQPHDPYETGVASAELLLRIVRREVRPATAWRKIPLLSHQEQYLTSGGPMKVWFDRAREHERDPRVLTISNFPMQPWLDVDDAGWATVVVTDGDPALAERLADEMADLAWSMRADFQVQTSVPVDEAVRMAEQAESGVVVLSDHGDSVFGGAAGDSTVLLEAMLRQGIAGRALVPLIDPVAVAALRAAGEGATVKLPVGGGVTGFFRPLEVEGVIRRIAPGQLRVEGLPDRDFDMGTTVVLDVGPVTLLVSEHRGMAGNHPGIYRAFGVEPADYRMAVLKTASNFQYFAPITSLVIRVDTPGPTQSDLAGLPWSRVPRPIYPLDQMERWRG
jgi:microcystin degradation protein MlrC